MWEEDGREENGRRRTAGGGGQEDNDTVKLSVVDTSACQSSASSARPTFHFQEWLIWLSHTLVQIRPTAQSSLCSGSARLS